MPASESTADPCRADRRLWIGFWLGLLIAASIVAFAESSRRTTEAELADPWLHKMNIDSTPYVLLLLVLPVCWIVRRPILARIPRSLRLLHDWLRESPTDASTNAAHRLRAVGFAAVVGLTAWYACVRVASVPVADGSVRFGELPPAFHDEFSYLFQAETFANGRWSYPSHPSAARLFDQMHVLNEGQFASRYFPGAGLWIAAVRLLGGSALAASWLATVLVSMLVFAIGRELRNNGVGWLAGTLVALSPGMNLFGNLLLAHQATLVGLSVFLWAVLRLQAGISDFRFQLSAFRFQIGGWSLIAGSGLAFAMLCRPMTAAGIGLPFGVWLLVWFWRVGRSRRVEAALIAGGFAVPLLVAFGILGWQNFEITGCAWKTPYSLYTELLTPRHMYGFNNFVRGELLVTPRVLDRYDRWAENLTPLLALQNVGYRWLASWLWTLGLVALTVSSSVFLAAASVSKDRRWLLVLAAILSLHAVHVPYWFDGIMHWHYVFESGPLWCLIAAEATGILVALFRRVERFWMPLWWGLVLLTAVLVNQIELSPFWPVSRVEAGVHELAFSRIRYADFQQLVATGVTQRPALVLVRHDPADRHIDYVSNHPSLTSPLLIGRLPAAASMTEAETLQLAQAAFSDRAVYVWDAKTRRVQRVR